MASSGIPNIIDLVQIAAYLGIAYESYIYVTKGQSFIPNDPIQEAIDKLVKAVWKDPITCPAGQYLVNGVCAADALAPTLTITNPSSLTLSTGAGTVNISGNASDAGGSGLKEVKYRVNTDPFVLVTPVAAGNYSDWSAAVTFNTAGSYTVDVEAYDNSNNVIRKTIAVTVTTSGTPPSGDTAHPTISITSPVNLANLTTGTITLSGTAGDDTAVVDVSVRVDVGGVYSPATQTSAGWATWTKAISIPAGAHTITARATDAAGNVWWHTINVTITGTTPTGDTTHPLIGITSIADNASIVSGNITLAGTASDDIGVTDVSVRIDNFQYVTATPGSSTWATWSIPLAIPTGTHAITAKATDAAGNQFWDTITVTVTGTTTPPSTDTTHPLITVLSPAEGTALGTATVTVTGTASDDVGIVAVGVKVDTGAYVMASITPALSVNWSVTVTVPPGAHILNSRAQDAAGNVWSKAINVTGFAGTVTLTPVVTLDKPNYNRTEVIIVTGSGFQANEDVGCRYTLDGVLQNAHDVTCNASGGFTTTFQTNAMGGGHITCTGRTSAAVAQSPGFNVVASGAYGRAYSRYARNIAYVRTRYAPTRNAEEIQIAGLR